MQVLTVLGARPQFIKAAPVSRALKAAGHDEFVVHTGQHYDYGMSDVFFDELELPEPDVNLGVGSGSHGAQTGRALEKVAEVIEERRPDWVMVYGDTNSTLAGALAAAKLNFPVAHMEAGLRSFNRAMPEEINRVVADHLSTLLLCPSQRAVDQLAAEGIVDGVVLSGDVMLDAFEHDCLLAQQNCRVLDRLDLRARGYTLMTMHRPANVDDPSTLELRVRQIGAVGTTVVWPVHPRAASALGPTAQLPGNVHMVEPMGRLDTIALLQHASAVITDSGGLQKEAYWAGVPCYTLRQETEWVETVEAGWNTLVPSEPEALRHAIDAWIRPDSRPDLYGDGHAATITAAALANGASVASSLGGRLAAAGHRSA